MNLTAAVVSVSAIGFAITVSFIRRINAGLVAVATAFVLALIFDIPASQVVSGWPTSLFVTLLGMTLLFTIAATNGTLTVVARICSGYTGGNRRLLPLVFFALAAVIAALGPGNIAACALLLPIALTVAKDEDLSSLLVSTMVITGSNVGGLSPIAPTGIIAANLAVAQGLEVGNQVFVAMIFSGTLFAALCYVVLGGVKLRRSAYRHHGSTQLSARQKTTLVVILLVVLSILVLNWNIGLTAFLGAVVLLFLRVGRDNEVLRCIPWAALILVCGVALLVNVMEITGGVQLVTTLLRQALTPATLGPGFVVIGGALSAVSSASGVVLPTLIPVVSGMVAAMPGALSAEQLISAIVIGAHVVTTSPISTLGALAVASSSPENRDALFTGLVIVAAAGVVFGAVYVAAASVLS